MHCVLRSSSKEEPLVADPNIIGVVAGHGLCPDVAWIWPTTIKDHNGTHRSQLPRSMHRTRPRTLTAYELLTFKDWDISNRHKAHGARTGSDV